MQTISITVINQNTDQTINALSCQDRKQKRIGLLQRDSFNSLLVIKPAYLIHTFSMRFKIDLIWLDKVQKVVKIDINVAPGRLLFCRRGYYCLEQDCNNRVLDASVEDQLFIKS